MAFTNFGIGWIVIEYYKVETNCKEDAFKQIINGFLGKDFRNETLTNEAVLAGIFKSADSVCAFKNH